MLQRIKGFVFGRSLMGKMDYLFHKLNKDFESKGTVKFEKLVHQTTTPFPTDQAMVLLGKDFTLILMDEIDLQKIEVLSIISNCLVFDCDLAQRQNTISIYSKGQLMGQRTDPFTASNAPKKGLFSFLKKGSSSTPAIEGVYDLFETFSTAIKLRTSIKEALVSQRLQVYQIDKRKTKYTDPFSHSTNATPFYGVTEKIMRLMPSRFDVPMPFQNDFDGTPMTEEKYCQRVKEQIGSGVVSPAFLLQHKPLCVVVYSSDLDGILVLNFDKNTEEIAPHLKDRNKGAKLLAVNMYGHKAASGFTENNGVEMDIIEGPNSSGRWKNFIPTVLDLIVDDLDQPLITHWINQFPAERWQTMVRMKNEYFRKFPGSFRMGFLMHHGVPCVQFARDNYPSFLEGN